MGQAMTLPPDPAPDRLDDLDAWFPRAAPPHDPALPQTLDDAHDALVASYAAKRAAAEAKRARYVRRWWEKGDRDA